MEDNKELKILPPDPARDEYFRKLQAERERIITLMQYNKLDAREAIKTYLMHQGGWLFVDEHKVLYYYWEGVFHKGADTKIKRMLEKELNLGYNLSTAFVNEVVAQMERESAKFLDEIRPDKNLLCLNNKILNVQTREVTNHSPTKVFFSKLPVDYDQNATCPLFLEFLSQILPDDKDRDFLQEFFGYMLYKDMPFHLFVIFIGKGRNGKTTLLKVIERMLGTESCTQISLQELIKNPFVRAELENRHANLADDLPKEALKNTGVLKWITGGGKITVHRKHGQPYTIAPFAKHCCAANSAPKSDDQSDAFMERAHIIPFEQQFLGQNADPLLFEKLTTETELSGVLNWVLEGLHRLMERKYFELGTTEERRQRWQAYSDSVSRFWQEYCDYEQDAEVGKELIYNAYVDMCHQDHIIPIADNVFWRDLRTVNTQWKEIRARQGDKRSRVIQGIKVKGLNEEKVQADQVFLNVP